MLKLSIGFRRAATLSKKENTMTINEEKQLAYYNAVKSKASDFVEVKSEKFAIFGGYGVRNGELFVILFKKKETKPFIYSYARRPLADVAKFVADQIAYHEKAMGEYAAMVQKRRDERKAVNAADFYKENDILVASWGYDQTNVNFYQVLKVSGSSIVIAEISSIVTGDEAMPHIDEIIKNKKAMLKRVGVDGRVRIESFMTAGKWNGKPQYCSRYA